MKEPYQLLAEFKRRPAPVFKSWKYYSIKITNKESALCTCSVQSLCIRCLNVGKQWLQSMLSIRYQLLMSLEAGKDKLRRWHFQNTNTYRIPEIHTKTFLSKSLWQNRDQQLKRITWWFSVSWSNNMKTIHKRWLNPLPPKIALVILLTVCHTVLVMLVWRIWDWINL